MDWNYQNIEPTYLHHQVEYDTSSTMQTVIAAT